MGGNGKEVGDAAVSMRRRRIGEESTAGEECDYVKHKRHR